MDAIENLFRQLASVVCLYSKVRLGSEASYERSAAPYLIIPQHHRVKFHFRSHEIISCYLFHLYKTIDDFYGNDMKGLQGDERRVFGRRL